VRSEIADASGNRELKHDAHQREVGFLHHWEVVLPKCSTNLLYKRKDT